MDVTLKFASAKLVKKLNKTKKKSDKGPILFYLLKRLILNCFALKNW